MTLAQNHRLPLNGNNIIYGLILCFGLGFGCSPKTTGPIKSKPPTKVVPVPRDSTAGSIPEPVDTLVLKDVSDKYPPIKKPPVSTTKKTTPILEADKKFIKDTYNIRLYIPLNSNSYNTASLPNNRFVQFYAGVLLALEDLENENVRLHMDIIDTESSDFDIKNIFNDTEDRDPDLIIGPFEREDLKTLAAEAQKKHVTVVSPWQTSTKIAQENRYYIQLKPNLKEHFAKIADHAAKHYKKGKVIVITHDNQEGISWFNYLNETTKKTTGKENFLTHFRVSRDSLMSPNTAFVRLFQDNPPDAIILPYYSFNDEDKLYSVLRRLSVDKGGRNITVYGMPLILDSDKIDYEFYSSLNIRIAISEFVDEDNYLVKKFKRRFFDYFGELANNEALKGYDVMMFVGRNILQYGSRFQEYIVSDRQTFLHTEIELQRAISDDTTIQSPEYFDYYENKKILILEFKHSAFHVID